MKDNYELSFTELLSKDQIVTRLDEATLELDMLKLKYNELRQEATMYEKLYREMCKKCWSIGL
jgi:hypothetical protein